MRDVWSQKKWLKCCRNKERKKEILERKTKGKRCSRQNNKIKMWITIGWIHCESGNKCKSRWKFVKNWCKHSKVTLKWWIVIGRLFPWHSWIQKPDSISSPSHTKRNQWHKSLKLNFAIIMKIGKKLRKAFLSTRI